MSVKLKNIAVLIDADNVSAKHIGHILEEIEKLGHIGCKKIYGDWGNAHIQGWQEALLKYAIDPIQQFAYVKGKNATDIGMVIEAMDLLYSSLYDGFCLISSDSDFTSLALRIRKNHVPVFGFGKRNTVDAFAKSCDRFFYVEDLLVVTKTPHPSQNVATTKNMSKDAYKQWTTQQLQTQKHLISAFNKIIKENPSAHDGWANLSYIASQLSQNYDNIKLEKYGYNKFSDLIIALRLYDIRRQPNGMWAKLKVAKKPNLSTASNKKVLPQLAANESAKANSNLFSATAISIKIKTSASIDAVLFRVNANAKVRGDEDMIFYGQTHSEDGSIELDQLHEDNKSLSEFNCDLDSQPSEITQLNFILSSELESLASDQQLDAIEVVVIDKQQNNLLFSGEFDVQKKLGKSLILFSLIRASNQWQLVPKHQSIEGDLRHLCEIYGIELSDD